VLFALHLFFGTPLAANHFTVQEDASALERETADPTHEDVAWARRACV
jgi:hypothetical protein